MKPPGLECHGAEHGLIPLWCPGMRHWRSTKFIPCLHYPLSLCERDFVLRCLHCCSPFLDGLLSLYGLLRLNKRALFLCQNTPSWRFLKSQAAAFVKCRGHRGPDPSASPQQLLRKFNSATRLGFLSHQCPHTA